MVLGALVDAGVESRRLEEALRSLAVTGFELSFRRETRDYLAGTRAEVRTQESSAHRHLPEIVGIIRGSALSAWVKEKACAIFERLAAAEAEVHGIAPEKVHFHEVGAVDAIVDIVGAVAGLELLGVDKVYTSRLPLGEGTVKCQHGLLPLPAPAVLGLVRDFEVRLTGIQRELTTPTGAAIVTTLAGSAGGAPSFIMEKLGYGFGRHPGEGLPNALRLIVGRPPGKGLEEVALLETNLDDVTGELAGYLIERSLEAGALDAYAVPVQMKKSRPGILFSVLVPLDRLERIKHLIHAESGTLGIRIQRILRSVLQRESILAETSFGSVKVKRSFIEGCPPSLSPEHDEVARIARERGMPYRAVLERLMAELHPGG
jgi:uncharacterized protein (TIGR00299 family) protein